MLERRINEVICSIEFRINVNAEQIEAPSYITNYSGANPAPVNPRYRRRSDCAEKVIEECKETINKLSFLRAALGYIHPNQSIYFLDNYHLFSLDEFYLELTQKIEAKSI